MEREHMGKNVSRVFLSFIFAAIFISSSNGEIITAASNAFTFPAVTAIKFSGRPGHAAPSFTCRSAVSKSAGVRFSWSFPSQAQKLKGSLTIFSPQGRSVRKYSLSANAGSVLWNAGQQSAVGVYIAKISYGANHQSLKFVVGK